MDRFDHLNKLSDQMQRYRYEQEQDAPVRAAGSFMSSQLSRENYAGEQGAQGQELSQVAQPSYSAMASKGAGKAILYAESEDDVGVEPPRSYALSLKIKYETQYGQHLCVVGSIPQLGKWKEYSYDLAWTPGHVWVSKKPIVVSVPLFQYKYVLMKDGQVERWERGVNRVADLRMLAQGRHNWQQRDGGKVKSALNTKEDEGLPLELEDEWERFRL